MSASFGSLTKRHLLTTKPTLHSTLCYPQ